MFTNFKLAFFFAFCTLFLYGQKGAFYIHYSTNKGLPSSVIYNLHIDKEGRLLMATEKGLYRYNGIQYTRFNCSTALTKEITDIVSGADGTILMHNFSGQIFTLKNDSLTEIIFEQQPKEIQNIKLYDSLLYLFSPKCTYTYRLKTRRLICRYDITHYNSDIIDAIKPNSSDEYINLTDSNLLIIRNNATTVIRTGKTKNLVATNSALYLMPYMGTSNKMYTIINDQCKVAGHLPFKQNPIVINTNLINGRFYITSQNGISVYDPANPQNSELWFEGEKTSDIKQDKEGNFWISTVGNGLFMIPGSSMFELSQTPCISIARGPANTLLYGDIKGAIHQINQEGELIKTYQPQNNMIEASFVWYDEKAGRIYSNTSVFDPEKGLMANQNHKQVDYCKNITRDSAGNYWLAKPYALMFVNQNKELEKRGASYALANPMLSNQVQIRNVRARHVAISPINQLAYASFIDGLYVINRDKSYRELKAKDGQHYQVKHFCFYKNRLYLGTLNKGVVVLENDKEVACIAQNNGLLSNTVLKIIPHENEIYVLTDEGLNKLGINSYHVENLTATLRLSSINIRDLAVINHILYLASDEGLIKINPKNKPKILPVILLKGIYSDSAFLPGQAYPEIPFSKHNIQIRFEPVTFNTFGSFYIQYKLEVDGEQHNNWNTLNAHAESVNLPNLAAGNYLFSIRIVVPQSNSYSTIKSVNFNIAQAWYRSGWAIAFILLSISILFILILVVRNRKQRIKQQEELNKQTLKKELAESKLMALRARMNPHFMYNVLNSIQSLVYSNRLTDANHYLSKYADLMRKYLEQSGKDLISIKEECDALQDYLELEKLRFEDSFTFEINIAPEIDIRQTFIPPLLIQPFVENSIRHGLLHKEGKKCLYTKFHYQEQQLIISIEDNGIGLSKSAEINARRSDKPKSFATGAIQQKLNLMNKHRQKPVSISYYEKINLNDTGTIITITIPEQL